MGDDVLAVLDALKLDRPILIGHSFGGEELSSIGSRRPERVAGLVYLDAGYRYALSTPDSGDMLLDLAETRRRLETEIDGLASQSLDDQRPVSPEQERQAVQELLHDLPRVQRELEARQTELAAVPAPVLGEIDGKEATARARQGRIDLAVFTGQRRYVMIGCPALVIFASPHRRAPSVTGAALAQAEARDNAATESRARLWRTIPNAKVVLIPHADHNVWASNPGDVLREIEAFRAGLR